MRIRKISLTNMALGIFAAGVLTACTQNTPSMMNVSPVEIARETTVEQIPLSDIHDTSLGILAEKYRRNGSGPLDVTMTFNPLAKDFTAMRAQQTLKQVKTGLKQKGVLDMNAQTLAVPDGQPSLIVAYDMVRAQAPSDCEQMPGLQSNETGRFIGDYKFGCGVEAMFAKQIARPSDLEGKSDMGTRPARRDAIVMEEYAAGVPREPLETIDREDIGSE